MPDNRNMFIAIALSIAILIGWQYFIAKPQMDKAAQQQTLETPAAPGQPAAGGTAANGATPATPAPSVAAAPTLTREAALAETPRVPIATPAITGSINLKGGRLDDVRLNEFHETVDKNSPTVIILSPGSGPDGYFAEFGWIADPAVKVPDHDTIWTVPDGAKLTTASPVTLTFDNGAGLTFTRTIALDEHYMFTVTDAVANTTDAPVSVTPYGRVTRLGEPVTAGYLILHEGLIGAFGDESMSTGTVKYKDLKSTPVMPMPRVDSGWFGITDKYWATVIIPEQGKSFEARYARYEQPSVFYQADFRGDPVAVPPGGKVQSEDRLFAGAKQVAVVDGYEKTLGIPRFELLIDWGWFYFITKPMFFLIDWFFRFFGNFGLAILAVTVVVKLLFFPLANKSYRSMSAMKKVQPQMAELRERYKDDRAKQQQALMELYKKEKINPLAGCWPVAVQIPVFFSLYKVLFVTIEMRHAPFFGWIKDLSAPDPTHIFNLFGLLPFDPATVPVIGSFLAIGVWPLIMGITMFVQMRLNPTPPDPTQKIIFTWMPLIFTFMLASFPAGLVIYWAWNNTLSVTQQYIIMTRSGVKVGLWDNIVGTFRRTPADAAATAAAAGTATAATTALPAPANDPAPPKGKSGKAGKPAKAKG